MKLGNELKKTYWRTSIVVLSLLLFFVAIPHTLEDFTLGEPARNGVPAPVLAAVVAGFFALQGLGLFFLGQNQRRGYILHTLIGIFWPLAAGSAQLPVIFTAQTYRAGFVSLFYVAGMILIGLLLCFASIQGLRISFPKKK